MMHIKHDQNRKLIDALRISDQDHHALVADLDHSGGSVTGPDKRQSPRLPYDHVCGLILQVIQPEGTPVRFLVKPRNISRNGLGVLHGGFIHPGTQCVVPLRNLAGMPTLAAGRIVSCRHIRGRVHEVGIHFSKPLELDQFVADAPPSAVEEQGVEAASDGGADGLPAMHGRVLVVDEWEDDRNLLAYDLRKLGLETDATDGGAEAVRRLQAGRGGGGGFDAVVAGEWLSDMSVGELTATLREGEDHTPIIALFSEGAEDKPPAGVAASLTRPYRIEHLARALRPCLEADAAGDAKAEVSADDVPAELSERWSEPEMRPMILSFLQGLNARLEELNRQVTAGGEGDDPLRTCLRLKAAAGSYALPGITQAADQLAGLLSSRAPLESVRPAMDRLNDAAAGALHATEQQTAAA